MGETYTRHDWSTPEPRVAVCRRCNVLRTYALMPITRTRLGLRRLRLFTYDGERFWRAPLRCGAKKERKRG